MDLWTVRSYPAIVDLDLADRRRQAAAQRLRHRLRPRGGRSPVSDDAGGAGRPTRRDHLRRER